MIRPYRSAVMCRLACIGVLLLTLLGGSWPIGVAAANTLSVTNCADSGDGTLRNQIAAASAGDTIVYDQDCTTVLTTSTLTLNKNLTIDGSGHQVILDGNNAVLVVVITNGVTASISGLTIQHGNGTSTNGNGGGISNHGTLTLTAVTLQENSTSNSGAGVSNDGTLTVQSSALIDNSAYGIGGGILNHRIATVVNSIFSGNVAGSPGGAIGNSESLTVANSTFVNNSAISAGGIMNDLGATSTMNNVIVANSTGGNLLSGDQGAISGNNNLIDDTTIGFISGSNNTQADPLLGPLGDYGGPTQTIPLLPGSPAIDAGDDAICAATGTGAVNSVDQRGISRPQGAHCDIGAYESRGFSLSVTGGDQQSAVVNTAFAEPLVATFGETGGMGLPGITVTFAVQPGSAGQSATLSDESTTSDASGDTSVTATANDTPGSYTVTASATGAAPITFNLTNLLPDTTPPVTTTSAVLTGTSTAYSDGSWTNQSVTVSLSASDVTAATDDLESGVATTFYILDNGTQETYAGVISMSTEGDHLLTFWSVDNANNTETTQTIHILIDKTPPTVAYSGNQGTYTVDQTVNIGCTAADQPGLSGLASSTCAAISGPAANFGAGSHTFSATATDTAGNTGSGSVTFTVAVTVDSLCNLTEMYAGNSRIASRLCAPLRMLQFAERMHSERLHNAAINSYLFLLHTAYARGLTADEIATLTQLARAL